MADVRATPEVLTPPEAPPSPTHVATRREDYRPPDWLVPEISLDFDLDPQRTRVRASLEIVRNGDHDRPLRLDGDELTLISARVDGREVEPGLDGKQLVLDLPGSRAMVETEVEIAPAANTKLMGLYASGGILCTQCEAEGFRRITFFPDRPDVLSRYRVRMEADKDRFPILLSNGNNIAAGEEGDGRHWAQWEDPFPKPSYLFALVAGDLKANSDSFTTMSGRKVALNIWVREADLPKTAHAMESLKLAMAWDEKVYGREYDLDLFNIVAVADFNMGAMENKGLNIFNSAYVLADQETATDADFDNISRVVAHEYFHNWSGDRITCRDWFQLSLKEGFTVFRDQSFSADIGSAPVKRIDDVRVLRAAQFPEDAGPLAHAVRPDSYIEISNFYTATVYNKGAELIRMMATVLGAEKFRAGTDLYFDRHDGEAATCDDFVKALEDGSGVDLSAFKIWYSQAGTPKVSARLQHDPQTRAATLHLEQRVDPTPGQPDKAPMPIPLRTALIGEDSCAEIAAEQLVLLEKAQATIEFANVAEPPLLSINRGFSAPIVLTVDRRPGELERLAQCDTDPFSRYEALQELMMCALVASATGAAADLEPVTRAVGATLRSDALDAAFKAEAILLPSEPLIADRLDVVDPDAVHESREALRRAIGNELRDDLASAYGTSGAPGHDLSPAAKGVRRLRNVALALIAAGDERVGATLAHRQFMAADNMTDRQAALGTLVSLDAPERDQALAAFYDRFHDDPLVLDKWFALQAAAQRRETVDEVQRLAHHPDFRIGNPNRLRALAGTFGYNHWAFHSPDGRGYRFLTDMILDADKLNPQVAARLIPPFGRWRRFEPKRGELMRESLERIVGARGLSKDVYEQASKSLA
ncbi:aminopeptidase N [Sphingomonas hankyongi]|uniref:Aminopeptidase N n=1 Tax=Sphingomonas hankyongi TaxID=2908209 RepID=A0ABT0S296_9SPHN|nr:aminopeptidase N [Sphingomonas hankyongi]MCL6729977.1 aminopeptidase N [Sphingomonas hankyongi]